MLLSEEAQELYQTLLEVKTVLGKVPTLPEKAYRKSYRELLDEFKSKGVNISKKNLKNIKDYSLRYAHGASESRLDKSFNTLRDEAISNFLRKAKSVLKSYKISDKHKKIILVDDVSLILDDLQKIAMHHDNNVSKNLENVEDVKNTLYKRMRKTNPSDKR
jgi:hypothetical protein